MVNQQTANLQEIPNLTPAQQVLQDLWEAHLQSEFVAHNTEDALVTMVDDAYVNDIPVMTGGVGKPAVREFYAKYFIPQIPPDTEMIPISRTIGTNQLVDEMVFKFTHTIQMDWMLPGIAPTGKRVEVPLVAIIGFRDGKVAHEHIYWDQASVLVQLGLLDPGTLPVVGADSARKLLDPNLPSNTLINCASDRNLSKAEGQAWDISDAIPLTNFPLPEGESIEQIQAEFAQVTRDRGMDILNRKGHTSYGVATVVAQLVDAILRDEKRMFTVSARVDPAYGVGNEVVLGVPCLIGRNGIESCLVLPRTETEQRLLEASATKLHDAYQTLLNGYKH